MPTRLTVPTEYRPWPSERELSRQAPDGDWRTLPDSFRPYLADTGQFHDDNRREQERRRAINTWKRNGIDPTTLPSMVQQDAGPTGDAADDNADDVTAVRRPEPRPTSAGAHSYQDPVADYPESQPGDQGDDASDDEAAYIAGPVGDDELVHADVNFDEDGRLFYLYVSTEPDGTHTALNSIGDHITDADGYDILTDADGYPEAVNRKGELLQIDGDGRVRYQHKVAHKGKDVASNREGQMLLRDGKPIEVDDDNYPVPVTPSRLSRILHGAQEREDLTDDEVFYNKDGVPVVPFNVAAPGGSLGRRTDGPLKSRHRILAGIATALFAVGGIAWYTGVHQGSSRVPAEGAVSAGEVEKYQLTTYDRSGAESFGTTYLQICLTNTGEEQQAARADYLKSVQSTTANTDCGVRTEDSKSSDEASGKRQPVSIRPNGKFEERPAESHGDGGVAIIGFEVAMADGSFTSYQVPIWAGTANGIPSYRVVGNLGKLPASKSEAVDDTDSGALYDGKLATELQNPLTSFFKAWGASTGDDLDAATSKDATGVAKEGMHGTVQNPTVTGAKVAPARNPDHQDGNTVSWDYRAGDMVSAYVNVEWETQTTAAPLIEANGYRVTLVYNGSKWEVQDIEGGVITPGESRGSSSSSSSDTLGSVDDLGAG